MLAVERPLSLQLHPDRCTAAAGFARENAAGIPLDAPERLYRDPHAKHEMLCALTPFRALCGLRPLARQRELLASLALPDLDALAPAPDDAADTAWLAVLLQLPAERRAALATAATAAAARRRGEPAFAWVVQLAEAYPGDPAALAPLLLEGVELAPGQALFLAPGEPHSYLHGTALELMDNSDNVLRGGLTPKSTAAEELLALATPRARKPEPMPAALSAGGECCWPVRCNAFALSSLRLEPGAAWQKADRGQPEILLCTRGEAHLEAAGEALVLARGEAAFVAGATPHYRLRGDAELYRARVPA
jgi:mannose-6-phosphate isomerase